MEIYDYAGFSLEIDGLVVYLDPEQEPMIPVIGVDFAATRTINVLQRLQRGWRGLLALRQIAMLRKSVRHFEKGWSDNLPPSFATTSWLYWSTPDKLVSVREWIEIAHEQDFFEIDDDWTSVIGELLRARKRWLQHQRTQEEIRLSVEFPTRQDGYVYLMRLSTGHYKIGLSTDPERRSRQIVSGLPLEIDIVHRIKSNQTRCLEYELHELFRDGRYKNTEWFELTSGDIAVITSREEVVYPWVNAEEHWQRIVERYSEMRGNLGNTLARWGSFRYRGITTGPFWEFGMEVDEPQLLIVERSDNIEPEQSA